MSALGTHEISSGIGLGLEPPLSPPVVRGPSASTATPSHDSLSDLPTPPPAIRPPETPAPAPALEPVAEPTPQASVPEEPLPEPAPKPQAEPAPEPELPAMAPPEQPAAPVLDYFAGPTPVPDPEPLPEAAPVEEPAEPPMQLPEIQSIPLMAPAPPPAPVDEPKPAAELPAMPPSEPEIELPALETPEPVLPAQPVSMPEVEQLLAPTRADFRVVVRLREGEGVVEVGSFRDFGTAMEGAQEVIEQFSTATEGRWPFYAGRFIRPDLIVSVDVVEGENAA